ncbi:hypothetical protein GGX14DRAFT_405786 [Mycena pura]|uniref:Uncharacterized protein n=1 Tax=Mycena pura TaxID=153505 RepID=A0AAD6UTB4_9AGAR|nr:hypothetical protein GGX14DRAFT_405786 [Mycena pura]
MGMGRVLGNVTSINTRRICAPADVPRDAVERLQRAARRRAQPSFCGRSERRRRECQCGRRGRDGTGARASERHASGAARRHASEAGASGAGATASVDAEAEAGRRAREVLAQYVATCLGNHLSVPPWTNSYRRLWGGGSHR